MVCRAPDILDGTNQPAFLLHTRLELFGAFHPHEASLLNISTHTIKIILTMETSMATYFLELVMMESMSFF